jgi:glycolate oxidase FAD binding subunit
MKPTTVSELLDFVSGKTRLTMCGGKSKTALHNRGNEVDEVVLTGISGMIEYDPDEYTFTALAGTPLEELKQALSEQGQYLPFDPHFTDQGATIGGTVASNMSGPGRYRYGGIRDFIIGVQYVDGHGNLIRSGGKVVKNAAGFDLSKLMVGSLGSYGVLIECSFKVFPKPKVNTTLQVGFDSMEEALERLVAVTKLPLDISAVELIPQHDRNLLVIRLGGRAENLNARIEHLAIVLGEGEIYEEDEEAQIWHDFGEFNWVPNGDVLVKIPLTPKHVLELDKRLSDPFVRRQYSVGCNVAWVSWQKPIVGLDSHLNELGLSGLVITGQVDNPRLGVKRHNSFSVKVKEALDPLNKWVEV